MRALAVSVLAVLALAAEVGAFTQTLRVPAKSIKSIAASQTSGKVELLVDGVLYTHFIRTADPDERRKAVDTMLADLKRAVLVEMQVMDVGDLHKVVDLKLIFAADASAADIAEALPKVYNGCVTAPQLAARVTGREAWEAAAREARAWQKDSRLHQLMSLTAMDPEGRAHSWLARFWSASAGDVNSITINLGPNPWHCSAQASHAVETFDVDAATILDTGRLYAIAAAEGGASYTEEGYTVKASLGWDREVGSLWYVSYDTPSGDHGQTIRLDARSGAPR
jgi:hypothetical protein